MNHFYVSAFLKADKKEGCLSAAIKRLVVM